MRAVQLDKSRFSCGADVFNDSQASNPNPSQVVCCQNRTANPTPAVDVLVGIAGPASVTVGSELNLTLSVKLEDGLEGSENVTVAATLPAGLRLVSAPGEPIGICAS